MTISSINTNIAAYYAQANIAMASSSTANSVSRLSSGNRIVKASDDVAGLAIGTSLATTVSVLKTALSSTTQGNSLLQVADAGLGGLSEIAKRQKTIAAQALSGSLSDTERGFLDQEFQALVQEIDQIVSSTTFSSVKLLDGSIQGSSGFTSNTSDSDALLLQTGADFVTISLSLPSAGDTITVDGVTLTFATADPGAAASVGKVTVGSSIANTAFNLAAALNKAASTDGRLANLEFVATATGVRARWTGGDGAGSVAVTVSSSFTSTANTTASTTIAIGSGTNGLGIDRTTIAGDITGSIFASAGSTAQDAGQALNLSASITNTANGVKNNADFVGKFGQGKLGLFTAAFTAADTATFSLKVGDITYTTAATDITSAGNVVSLLFTGADQYGTAAGGNFVMKLNGTNTPAFSGQSGLDVVVKQINDGLADITVQQNRDVLGVANLGAVNLAGVNVANTSDFQFDYRTDDFINSTISSFTIKAPTAGGSDAVFEAVINGELYRSVAGIGNQIGKNTAIGLQNVNDSTKVFTLTTGNTGLVDAATTTMDLATQAKADAVAAALATSLGIGIGAVGLSFQVGASSSDKLTIQIADASTASLYGGLTLSVDTQENATIASAALDTAIQNLTNIRAGVGAAESRFAFAASNLQSSIQNQDAARSELLDTDIAAESTNYAGSQVKLQAGIATLAQANQQLQSYLKLLG
jgi:flagellin